MTSSEQQQIVTLEASAWYARLRSPQVSQRDRADFNEWLNQNPAHLQEYQELDAFWEDLGVIAESPEARQAQQHKIPATNDEPARQPGIFHNLKRWWLAPVAVTCTLLIAAGYLMRDAAWGSIHYSTELGEQRTVELADHSLVTLNTQTELRVDYSGDERRIHLLSGQAYFEVARDPARAFVVSAGSGEVKALGTEFDIYQASDKVTVTLLQGRVEVSQVTPAKQRQKVQLSAEQQVEYNNSEVSSLQITQANIKQVSAWRKNKLEFDDTPLAEAIAEANRYSRVKIVLASDSLQQARISGSFAARRNDLLAEGIQDYFDLRLSRPNPKVIVLQVKSDQ